MFIKPPLFFHHAPKLAFLQRCTETLISCAIQPQKVSHLAKMVNSPETLGFPLRVGTFKPREAKRSRLECSFSIGSQEALNLWLQGLQYQSAYTILEMGKWFRIQLP